jgi:integrase
MDAGWIDVRYALDPKAGFKGPKSRAGERNDPRRTAPTPRTAIRDPRRPVRGVNRGGTGDTVAAHRAQDEVRHADVRYAVHQPVPRSVRSARACANRASRGPPQLRDGALVRAGYDIKLVSEWIGHAQASTTLNIYAKRRGRSAESTVLADRMNRYLAGGAL